MKKSKILLLFFAIINFLFSIIKQVLCSYCVHLNYPFNIIKLIFPLVLSLFLIIAVVIERKETYILYFIFYIIETLTIGIYNILHFNIYDISIRKFYDISTLVNDISLSVVFLIIILIFINTRDKQELAKDNSKDDNIKFDITIQSNKDDLLVALSEYKELLNIGAITQEEFDIKKKELLDL